MDSKFISHSVEETIAIGKQLAIDLLKIGDIVVLRGDLGAGKTQLTKGIANSFGVQEYDISSPTFALANEYSAVLPDGLEFILYHLDCYRFERPEELLELGVEEYLYPKNGICIIEWPERIEQYLPDDRIEITIQTLSETDRDISIKHITA